MPEYKQGGIAVELEKRIRNGVYRDKLPPVNLLADEFQVNIRTMTKSLSLLTRKGLIAKKRGIGAFVNSTRPVKTRVLVRYTPGRIQDSIYHAAIWDGLRDGAEAGNCEIEQRRSFEEYAEAYDGIIFVGHDSEPDYEPLKQRQQPFVVIEQLPQPDICTVSADVYSTAYSTLYRMLESGMRRIAYIGMTTSRVLYTDVAKFHAWLAATDDVLHQVDFDLVRHIWPHPDHSYAAACDILRHTTPDAFFITSDLMAEGVYRALAERGLKVPGDIGLLGCDGLDLDLTPRPASIRVPRYELGLRSITMLLDMIREPGRRSRPKIVLPTEFAPGDSLRFDPAAPPPAFVPRYYSGFAPPSMDDAPSSRPRRRRSVQL